MRPLASAPALVPGRTPVVVDRGNAARLARDELRKAIYHRDDPSLLARAITWLLKHLLKLVSEAAGVTPGGVAGLIIAALVVVGALVAWRLRRGSLRVRGAADPALFSGRAMTADEHRAAADRFAAAGDWAQAVRERLRAVVRDLEERAVLDERPGRTADEAARDAGLALPEAADGLRRGARVFDDVWYGGRTATAEMDAELRALDTLVRRSRPGARAAASGPRWSAS